MDKKIELDFVEYRGVEYPCRTIVIFGQTELTVADESLSDAMGFDHPSELCNEDAIHLDDEFAGYVPIDVLRDSDEVLAAYVEENFYQNEPTEPNTAMPFDWFDHSIDCQHLWFGHHLLESICGNQPKLKNSSNIGDLGLFFEVPLVLHSILL